MEVVIDLKIRVELECDFAEGYRPEIAVDKFMNNIQESLPDDAVISGT